MFSCACNLLCGADPAQPGKPNVMHGTETTTQVRVSWTYAGAADSYTVKTYEDGISQAVKNKSGISRTEYTVTGLTPGKSYSFAVIAVSGGINGSESPHSDNIRTGNRGL